MAPSVVCETSDIRNIVFMLKAIDYAKRAWLTFTAAGLRLSAEAGKSLQAVAYLPASIFSKYEYSNPTRERDAEDDDEGFAIEIQLPMLIQCLEIFGGMSNPSKKFDRNPWNGNEDGNEELRAPSRFDKSDKLVSMRMTFDQLGDPLILLLEESGVITRCELTTYEPDSIMDIVFEDQIRVAKLIMKSTWLNYALQELDSTCSEVHFKFEVANAGNKSKARFVLQAQSAAGVSEVEFPFEKDQVELFECNQNIINCYAFTYLKDCKKALSGSTKTSIRVDENGLLSMQFLMPLLSEKNKGEIESGFVEFLVLSKTAD